MGEDFRRFMLWARTFYARYGVVVLVMTSVLFVAVNFTDSRPLRVLAFSIGGVLVLVAAGDVARSLLERDKVALPPRYLPVTPLQIVLAVVQTGIYTLVIFWAIGPLVPFIFILPVFVLSSVVAWRNVRLWYRHSLEYEDDLKEEQRVEELRLQQRAHWRDNER